MGYQVILLSVNRSYHVKPEGGTLRSPSGVGNLSIQKNQHLIKCSSVSPSLLTSPPSLQCKKTGRVTLVTELEAILE
jgi:hypothetical protein